MKILIVDDLESKIRDIKTSVSAVTTGADTSIDEARSVNQASRKCSKTQYDLIILDMNIPVEDGKEIEEAAGIRFLKNLRTQARLKKPKKLIGLTAHESILDKCQKEFEHDCYTLIKYDNASIDWEDKLRSVIGQLGEENLLEENSVKRYKVINPLTIFIPTLASVIIIIFLDIPLTNTTRILIFFLCSMCFALLFGEQTCSRFQFKFMSMCGTVIGTGALGLIVLFGLQWLTVDNYPSVAVFEVYDSKGQEVTLKKIQGIATGKCIIPVVCCKKKFIFAIFPEGTEYIEVEAFTTSGKKYMLNLTHTPGIKQKIKINK